RVSGRESLAEAWPRLTAVFATANPAANAAPLERAGGVVQLPACLHGDAVLAVHDPRQGALRLIPDQGVYYEFVPVDQVGRWQPQRQGLGEVVPGAAYALAATDGAGLWACLVGLTVCFERTGPPLLRSVEPELPFSEPAILPLRSDAPAAFPPPHPQT